MLLYALITTNFDWGIAVCYNSYGYKQNARLVGPFKHHFISDIPVVHSLYKKKKNTLRQKTELCARRLLSFK